MRSALEADDRTTEDLVEILSVAAHELRTPATVILGLASTLAASRAQMTEPQVSEAIMRLDRQAKRMVGLLEDLLDVSRMQTRQLEVVLQPVELSVTAAAALNAAAPPAAKHVTVDVPEGLMVVADPAGLERVLVNLLTNAYRYGGENIRVKGEHVRGSIHLVVTDDGPGVPEDLLPHLFKPFRAGPGGTGLGLSIVLGLIESFGGSVSYLRAQPQGAQFDVRLANASQPRAEERSEYASPSGERLKVLIVDDEPDVLFLLRLTLETAGYEVHEAAHGAEALASIQEDRPTVLVTDLMMPVMDGRELIRHVREDADTANLPVMLLSANPDHSSGADFVMRKPFNPRDLTRAVDDLASGRES